MAKFRELNSRLNSAKLVSGKYLERQAIVAGKKLNFWERVQFSLAPWYRELNSKLSHLWKSNGRRKNRVDFNFQACAASEVGAGNGRAKKREKLCL